MTTSAVSGLRRKIRIAFLLQVAAISFATVLGVYGASVVLKHLLVQRALQHEATHYWQRRAHDPDVPLPDTYYMTGYLVAPGARPNTAALPASLRTLEPGYHVLPGTLGGALVYVEANAEGSLYLLFKPEPVASLSFWFGIVPLTVVLVLVYGIAFVTYKSSKRAVSPVIWLADVVKRWDPKHPRIDVLQPDNLPIDADGETQALAASLHDFGSRIETLLERERNFTRDASHELRTPLTVVRVASDILLGDPTLTAHAQRSVKRIQSAGRDMEALIEAFLILARVGDTALEDERFLVNDIVNEQVHAARTLCGAKPVTVDVAEDAAFALHAPPRVLAVLLGNLIRNACIFTDRGRVTVRVGRGEIAVEDTGIGMSADELAHAFEPFYRGTDGRRSGQGIGLNIVSRLCERFGWTITLDSEPGRGTVARVLFPRHIMLLEH